MAVSNIIEIKMHDPEFSYVMIGEQPAILQLSTEKEIKSGNFLVIYELAELPAQNETGSIMEMDVIKVKQYESLRKFLEQEGCSVATLFAFEMYLDKINTTGKKINPSQRKLMNKSKDAIDFVFDYLEKSYGFSSEGKEKGIVCIWIEDHRGRTHFRKI